MNGQLKACESCGDRTGHDPLGAAACAYRQESTTAIREIAAGLGADPAHAADLLAHLRSCATDPAAFSTARYVLELGWRPAVPGSSGEQATA